MPDLAQSGALAIQALIPIVVPFVVWGARQLIPKIPRAILPPLAVVAGVALEAFGAFVSDGTWSPMVGALLGACGVFVREFVSTIKQHGLNG